MHSLIIFGAKYLFVAVILLWLIAWLQAGRRLKMHMVSSTIIGLIIAAILDKIGDKLYYDPRPFVTHHIQPLVAHAADNGFPSEHTLFSATLAAAIFFYRPRYGILTFIIALIVGASRVAAHVHSPIDIIGGALIGALAGWLGYLISSKLMNTKPARQQSESH